jgi:hypothetical protein
VRDQRTLALHRPFPILAVELGSRLQSTAIAVVDRAFVGTGEIFNKTTHDRQGFTNLVSSEKVAVEYRVRHLERRHPPVRYKGVASRVAEIVESVGTCLIVVDITAVGRPIYSMIEPAVNEVLQKLTEIEVKHLPMTISGTGAASGVSRSPDAGYIVPRRDLVSSALLLFEQDQIKIAEALDLAGTLTREFVDFKPKAPKEELEGWRFEKNDDLVLAVSMATWAGEKFLRKISDVPAGTLESKAMVT